MPKKPRKPDDPKQSKRFIALAREVQATGSDAALKRSVVKIAEASREEKKTAGNRKRSPRRSS